MVRKQQANSRYLIREAREDDLPVLVNFMARLALHVAGAPPQSLKEDERDRLLAVLHHALDDASKQLVVAEVPEVGLVGMGYVYVVRSQGIWEQTSDVEFRSAVIDDIWIEPEFRKLGIFPDLLRKLVTFAEDRGAYELILEYSASNKEAKSAWTRLGFDTVGVRAAALTSAVKDALASRP